MDFRLSDEQQALTQGVRDYLAGKHGREVLRRLDQGENRDPQIWQGLVDMGLVGLLVPEEHGGMGMRLLDATLIASECGRACLAEPLVDTAFVAVPWLLSCGETKDMAAIASGDKTIALAHVINGWVADEVTQSGKGDSGATLQSVDPLRNLSALAGEASDDSHLLNLGALMSAAQLVGLAEAMREQTIDYVKMREQFGQPIGAFQSVKHHLATATVALEFAKPVLWRAAQAMDDSTDTGAGADSMSSTAAIHVSHAKIAAGDAALHMAETAIQLHGAMGYSYEVDLHFWMKRTWALVGAWGSRAYHIQRIDEAVLGGALPIGASHSFT